MTRKSRLTTRPETTTLTVANIWQSLAADVEDSLIAAGAEPNDDYVLLELYRLTQPMVTELVVTGKIKVMVTTSKKTTKKKATKKGT